MLRCVPPFLLVLLPWWLAGCAAPLPYRPLPLDLADARAAFAARALDDAALQGFLRSAGVAPPEDAAAWTCGSLALAATWYSPALAVAQARWAQALAQRVSTLQPAGGTVDAQFEHHSQTDALRARPWTVALGFEFTLPSPARRAALTAQADAEVREARLALAAVAWQVQQSVRVACVQAQVADARRQLQGEALTLQVALLEGVAQQVRQGMRSPAELRTAERQVAEAQRLAAQAEADVITRQQVLRATTALPPASRAAQRVLHLNPLAQHFPAPQQTLAEQLALDNRLDLQQAAARFERADAALQLAVARQYPQLSLHPGYEWDQNDHRLRIGVALPVSLPAAHPAEIAFAEAERAVQAAEVLATQQAVLQSVAQARTALAHAEQQRALQAAQQAGLDRHVTDTATAVQLGALDQQDLRQAQLDALQGRRLALDLQAASALAALELQDALHTPMEPAE